MPKKEVFSEIDEDKVLGYVQRHPGCKAETMRAELGCKPERLAYVLRRLRDSGKVKVKGMTRAMTYTAKGKKAA